MGVPEQKSEALCSKVDALVETAAGETYAFRGPHYYKINDVGVDGGRRSLETDWGLPADIDTAFTWHDPVDSTFVFKGNQYWKFTFDPVSNKPEMVSGR